MNRESWRITAVPYYTAVTWLFFLFRSYFRHKFGGTSVKLHFKRTARLSLLYNRVYRA